MCAHTHVGAPRVHTHVLMVECLGRVGAPAQLQELGHNCRRLHRVGSLAAVEAYRCCVHTE